MSKKYNDQKLIIENFNKWVNEEEKIEESDTEIVEKEEQIDEAMVSGAATAFILSKFVTALHRVLGAYNEMSKVTDELLQDPNAPESIKNAAASAKKAGADIKSGAGSIADDIPIGQQLGQKAIEILIKKHTGLDISLDDLGISIPGLGQKPSTPAGDTLDIPEPEPQPDAGRPATAPESEPEDDEARAAQGLLPKDKADRLAQLKAKYRKKKKK